LTEHLPLSYLVIRSIRETNYDVEETVRVEDACGAISDVAVPKGHENYGRNIAGMTGAVDERNLGDEKNMANVELRQVNSV